jgi:hypothetical protein
VAGRWAGGGREVARRWAGLLSVDLASNARTLVMPLAGGKPHPNTVKTMYISGVPGDSRGIQFSAVSGDSSLCTAQYIAVQCSAEGNV